MARTADNSGRITARTLLPLGLVASILLATISIIIYVSRVEAATQVNKTRIDYLDSRLGRIESKIDRILEELKR